MSKHVVVHRGRAPAKRAEERTIDSTLTGPAFSFRYSYTEISAAGSTASVRRRETRFENGTLKSEALETTVDRSTYDALVRDAQATLLRQTATMMRSMFWFLSSPAEHDRKD